VVCGAGEGERKRDRAGHKVRTEMVGPTRGRTVISQGKGRRAAGEETVGERERRRIEVAEKNLVQREGGYEVGGAYYLYHVVVKRTHELRPNHKSATVV